ncbi:MAG: D-tyrosyl-tRNA(Tyr) deacylase [Planctomycetes bacterium]|nr:D-tyrosyl-tRNA(Tyr) deacylase [Planctomycetota bacterium]
MIAVVQRASEASVRVKDEVVGAIGHGLLVLLGVTRGDSERDAEWMARKLAALRIFSDADGKMNLSVKDVSGGVLLISQFTLLGDASKGNRPGFSRAEDPGAARVLYERVCEIVEARGLTVARGRFGESMQVALVNNGPVTILLDSRETPEHGGERPS